MKKTIIITAICIAAFIIIYSLFKNDPANAGSRGSLYAGSEACIKCHGDIYISYMHTAHYIASRPATANTIHGSFATGSNIFQVNDSQKIVMEKLDRGLYQAFYINDTMKQRYRFDIVFGGVKGESYLSWKENELYQLPISYFSRQQQWSTSPGYGYSYLDYHYRRPVRKQCMECHTSYINDMPPKEQGFNQNERFDKSTLIYSIDCERCHGPSAQHVDFQNSNPEIKTAHFITVYKYLNRVQKMDMCAICHSGNPGLMLRSSFEFVPGDTFAKFKIPELDRPVDTSNLDVHGNQVQLLQSSKCYINTTMNCATCHDVHRNSRGDEKLFTQKCLNCHNMPNHVYCKMANKLSDASLKANCISCHMPALPTKKISVQVTDTSPAVQFFVHTHHIAVYPEEVKKILAYINK